MLVPGANMTLEKDKDDRRGADRFPIEREVRYKILSRKTSAEGENGTGLTVNMSSNGVLFTTDRYLLPGRRLEVSISWPAQLNSKVALKLVARGRVVRSEEGRAAIEIHQYEFRTQASQGNPRRWFNNNSFHKPTATRRYFTAVTSLKTPCSGRSGRYTMGIRASARQRSEEIYPTRMRNLVAVLCLGSGFCLADNVKPPTLAEARAFLDRAQSKLLELSVQDGRADWVKSTFITYDTEILAAKADEDQIAATMQLAKESTRFSRLKMPEDMARQFKLLRLSLTLAAPSDPKQAQELTQIATRMEGIYGSGKYCPAGAKGDNCLDLDQLSDILRTSTDPAKLLDAWRGWRTVSPPMRPLFQKYVELGNQGARELGFADMGAMWRSKYDMPADAFPAEMDRLWEQVKPLYLSLHAYVRWKLREKYGDLIPASGPIPAHLLGNMWAQEWENIYPLVAPKDADPGYDLTAILKGRGTQPLDMVKYGEHFFTSLGFAPLPQTFWERSMFVKPRDRDVVCHASAWDVDFVDDLRIKAALRSTPTISRRSITSWATTSTSAPTTSSRFCSVIAPTTDFMKPSAIPSRCR
jgi:hypothetical protein